jgi:hypothetical protein
MKKSLLSMVLLLSILSGYANASYLIGGVVPRNEISAIDVVFGEGESSTRRTYGCGDLLNQHLFGNILGASGFQTWNGQKCFDVKGISIYSTSEVYNRNEVYNRGETYNKSEVYNKGEIDKLILNQSIAFELAGGSERLRESYKLTDSVIEQKAQLYVEVKMRNEVKKQVGMYLKKAPEADDMIYIKRSELAKLVEDEVAKQMKSLRDEK